MNFLTHLSHSVNRATNSQFVRLFLNHHFKRYGSMTELRIDDQAKTIDATLLLRGEKDPISLHIASYALHPDTNPPTLTLGTVTVSREWMNTLAQEMLQGKTLPLPPAAVKMLNLIL